MTPAQYAEAKKSLKMKEENSLRNIEWSLNKVQQEEESKLKEDLQKKHTEEQIELRRQQFEMRSRVKEAASIGEDSEAEKKALKQFEEGKRKENERKMRNLAM